LVRSHIGACFSGYGQKKGKRLTIKLHAMKKMSFVLIVVLLPFAMLAQEESFTVTGKIGNWNAPAKIFLVYKKDGKNMADSVEVQNGTFTIKGTLKAPFHATLLLEYAGQSVWNIRSEEHTSELQSRLHLVCRLLLEKKKKKRHNR